MLRLVGLIVGMVVAYWSYTAWRDPGGAVGMVDQAAKTARQMVEKVSAAKAKMRQATPDDPLRQADAPLAQDGSSGVGPDPGEGGETACDGGNCGEERAGTETVAIWKPFRSRSSALGFVHKLSEMTDLDVVVDQTPRGFVPMVRYDPAERDAVFAKLNTVGIEIPAEKEE